MAFLTDLGTGDMTITESSRRKVLQGMTAAGIAGIVGGSAIAAAQEEEEENEEEEEEETNDENDVNDVEEEMFAGVRFGHLSPDTQAVDVYIGKQPDRNPTIADLSLSTFGPGFNDAYLQLVPGEYDVYVTPSGSTMTDIEIDAAMLEPGGRYSALAIGRSMVPDDEEPDEEEPPENDENDENDEENNDEDPDENGENNDEDPDNPNDQELQPLLILDAMDAEDATPSAEEAEVSFVHASPDAGAVDITVDDETVLEDVDFGGVSDYFALEPGEHEISILSEGEPVLTETRNLREATSITVYVHGLVDATDELPGLSTVSTNDGTNPLTDGIVMR